MDKTPMNDSVELIPQPHGGSLMPPPKPGEIRNPTGRRTLGAFVKDCFNQLALQQPNRRKLVAMIRDEETPSNMRIAAVRYLRMQEHADLADFEEVVDGNMKLRELRDTGIDTAVVKKIKRKVKRYKQNEQEIEEVENEIELHDRSGQDFDRVLDRTDGKPEQVVTGKDGDPIQHELRVRFDDRT